MRQLPLTILLIIAAVCHAAEFGDISIERLPSMHTQQFIYNQYETNTYRVKNNGLQPATVTIRETDRSHSVSNDISYIRTRSLEVAPQTTALLTLYSPPLLATVHYGAVTCNIAINGKDIKLPFELAHPPATSGYEDTIIQDILMSPSLPYQNELNQLIFSYLNRHVQTINHMVASTAIEQWPTHVREYAGYDAIFISSTDKPKQETRQALDDYVRIGGKLVIIVPEDAPWPQQNGPEGLYHQRQLGYGKIHTVRPVTQQNKAYHTSIMQKITATSDGKVRADILDKESFFQKEQPLNALLNLLNNNSYKTNRIIPDSMLDFPKTEIPLFALFLVMIIFAVIIGPLNYWYLQRKGKQLLLVLTTPVISIVFCVIVFLFITFREGWQSHGAAVGFTLLDQTEHQATTYAKVIMNAAFRPSGGFRFSSDELLSFNQTDGTLEVLDEPGQVIAPSIMKTRVPFSYNICKTEPRREQLEITFNGKIATVVNGLGAEITDLLINSPDGAFAFKHDAPLPPGGSISIKGEVQNTPFHSNTATVCPPILPPEEIIKRLGTQSANTWLPTGYYFAKTKEPLFHSLGMTPDTLKATHVVIGRF
ncbi:MAG: hypothetical protein K6G44_10590 [Lentisphaeria bacterium]|nr:hypothetical protein [Lentisphaeria bacterium]